MAMKLVRLFLRCTIFSN